MFRKVCLVFLCICLVIGVDSTIAPGSKSKTQPKLKVRSGPQDEDVFQRDLVEEEPSPRDILVHNAAYYKDTTLRRFNSTVLGYVTAWNSHGYDVAKTFAKKFDVISPVWFQIIKEGSDYKLAGKHDIDAGWVRDVQRKGKTNERNVQMLPRVLFDKFTERDFSKLLSYEKERDKVNQIIIQTCKENGFDGIVLEFWSLLAGRIDDHFLYMLVLHMAKTLINHNLKLILVIPPMRPHIPNVFNEQHLNHLYRDVYAFSLMTYDYSNVQRPGANAPLYWMRSAIENLVPKDSPDFEIKRSKILMGLNMYGNDYTPDGGSALLGPQYLELLGHYKKRLEHDERDIENYFEVRTSTGRHTVFYPTLYSINERIKLAREMGVGLSIWELGQGLDYFYDLF